jgi:hypothetical protein
MVKNQELKQVNEKRLKDNKTKANGKIGNINIYKSKFDFALAGLFVVLLFILYVRIRLLRFPLERDEGEYAYIAQLILRGFPPYTMAFNMKFPGIYYIYALIISIFGQTTIAIHMGLMIINISTIIFIYFIIKKLINCISAFFASTVYAILSTCGSLYGEAAHATHFVTFFGIIGILFLIQSFKSGKGYYYLFTGILMSFSVLMKQSFSFTIFAVILILFNLFNKKMIKGTIINFLYFVIGFIIPLLFTSVMFIIYGNFDKFWFWTITYAGEYGSTEYFSNIYRNLSDQLTIITKDFNILWILFLIGIPFIFINKRIKNIKWALLLFTILSILSVFPGYYFRPHYFITLLPAIAIIIAILFDYLTCGLNYKYHHFKFPGIVIFIIIILISINNHKDYFFNKSSSELCKEMYPGNPFVESVTLSDYVKSKTGVEDKILVLGSEPQIYFYSQRNSVSPYIYMYDLMYDNDYSLSMQKELIKDLEKAKPKIILYVNIHFSWFRIAKSNDYIFKGFFNFIKNENYKLTGIVDNAGLVNTIYLWNNDALNYNIQESSNYILIFEKSNNPV